MRVQLELEDVEGFTGTLTGPDGRPVAFVGRLGLLNALDRALAAVKRDSEHGTTPPPL